MQNLLAQDSSLVVNSPVQSTDVLQTDSNRNVIKCEIAENGKAVLSIDGALFSSDIEKRKRKREVYKVLESYNAEDKNSRTVHTLPTPESEVEFENVYDKFGLSIVKSETSDYQIHFPCQSIVNVVSEHDYCRTRAINKSHTCEICQCEHESHTKLKCHKMKTHCMKKFRCKLWDPSFRNSKRLINMTHADEEQFECNVCSETFTSCNRLWNHRKVHENVKVKYCDLCKAAFRNKLGLTKHMRVHADHRAPEVCKKCDARFATTKELVEHSVMHDGEKPYMCYLCEAEFYYSYTLDQHLRMSGCVNKNI